MTRTVTRGPWRADDELIRAMEDDVDGCGPLAVISTSGSTSAPMGVLHAHAELLADQRSWL